MQTVGDWIVRSSGLNIDLAEMNELVNVTETDAKNVRERSTLFASNQDMGKQA